MALNGRFLCWCAIKNLLSLPCPSDILHTSIYPFSSWHEPKLPVVRFLFSQATFCSHVTYTFLHTYCAPSLIHVVYMCIEVSLAVGRPVKLLVCLLMSLLVIYLLITCFKAVEDFVGWCYVAWISDHTCQHLISDHTCKHLVLLYVDNYSPPPALTNSQDWFHETISRDVWNYNLLFCR